MEGFAPILSTIGGVLIGFAAIARLYFTGRISGENRMPTEAVSGMICASRCRAAVP